MNILPACLPTINDNFEGKTCYFTGWGLTYSSRINFNCNHICNIR